MSVRLDLPNSVLMPQVAELLAEGNRVRLLTKGASMRPFIEGGRDSVELVRRDCYNAGDIVLARIEGCRYVLHRISSSGEKVILKGDGNLSRTETCLESDILGAVVKIVHPDDTYVDCTTARFARISSVWRGLPQFVRRVVLGIYRRIPKRKIYENC